MMNYGDEGGGDQRAVRYVERVDFFRAKFWQTQKGEAWILKAGSLCLKQGWVGKVCYKEILKVCQKSDLTSRWLHKNIVNATQTPQLLFARQDFHTFLSQERGGSHGRGLVIGFKLFSCSRVRWEYDAIASWMKAGQCFIKDLSWVTMTTINHQHEHQNNQKF